MNFFKNHSTNLPKLQNHKFNISEHPYLPIATFVKFLSKRSRKFINIAALNVLLAELL